MLFSKSLGWLAGWLAVLPAANPVALRDRSQNFVMEV